MANIYQEILLRRKEVERQTGLSRSGIYDLMSKGAFPKTVRLSKRTVAWKQSDIHQWIADRIAAAESAA